VKKNLLFIFSLLSLQNVAQSGLIPANKIRLGSFLTPPEYKKEYGIYSEFNKRMGLAAKYIAKNPPTATSDFHASLDRIALIRRDFAIFSSGIENPRYGRSIRLQAYQAPNQSMVDTLYEVNPELRFFEKKPTVSRHRPFLDKVKSIYSKKGDEAFDSIHISGMNISLSHSMKYPEGWVSQYKEIYQIRHPSFSDTVLIADYAIEQMVSAFSEQPWNFDKIANSYRLLCHATLWEAGTPSILESFLDGMFRSRGFAFPRKKSEPFWSALLHQREEGAYTWKKFMSNF